jgi:DNA-binding HxlR family transcriptional regulator
VHRVKTKTYNCPVEAALDVIGGKWKALILWWLQERTWRFAELRRQIPGITEKMLTQQLRELEADGIVQRRVHATVPPKVEYSLTDYGWSLKRALREICAWGKIHMERIGAIETGPERAGAAAADGQTVPNLRTRLDKPAKVGTASSRFGRAPRAGTNSAR